MHLSPETALDLIEGRMDKNEESFWQKHLEDCDPCRQQLGQWRQFQTDLKRSHLKSAPGLELAKAIQIFPPGRREGGKKSSVLAALVFDSFLDPAFAGARGTSGGARQLV